MENCIVCGGIGMYGGVTCENCAGAGEMPAREETTMTTYPTIAQIEAALAAANAEDISAAVWAAEEAGDTAQADAAFAAFKRPIAARLACGAGLERRNDHEHAQRCSSGS